MLRWYLELDFLFFFFTWKCIYSKCKVIEGARERERKKKNERTNQYSIHLFIIQMSPDWGQAEPRSPELHLNHPVKCHTPSTGTVLIAQDVLAGGWTESETVGAWAGTPPGQCSYRLWRSPFDKTWALSPVEVGGDVYTCTWGY